MDSNQDRERGSRRARPGGDTMAVDIWAFCRDRMVAQGEIALSGLERLSTLLAERSGTARWEARGRLDAVAGRADQPVLDLVLRARISVSCVRCLEPVECQVDEARSFLLVADEETAEQVDDPDSAIDVIVGGRRFDLAALIEDELILAIPAIVRHAHCDGPDGVSVGEGAHQADAPPTQRPFASLGKLSRGDLDD
ncbi:MAG: DUF177 domain-containing protein [Burkholderiaceae bacterium]|nr:DUF177 domain-containing protein [Burkholderiaceae bacterium]